MWLLPCSFCHSVSLHFRHSHRTATARKSSPSIVRSVTLHFLIPSSPCLFQHTLQTKTPPALPRCGWRPAHSVLSLSTTLAPLADGSRLSTTQAKNYFAIAPPVFTASFRLRAVLPVRLIPLRPHTAPDHPPLKYS